MAIAISNLLRHQPVRYVINGLAATCVSYAVLNACIHLAHVPSAGIANFIAAVLGITASFLGSRYFVFPGGSESAWHQLARFWLLYAVLALMQAAVLFAWTDLAHYDYRVGFLIGTLLQMVCSYFGGKHWVFKR
jgi:putative flippase GtrA|nr:GtrA family protein [Dyella sp. ASV24]